jgi:hypothetical protein
MRFNSKYGPITMHGKGACSTLAVLLLATVLVSCSPDSGEPSPTKHMPPRHHGLIHGTKGDDVLYGTESGERIESLAGRDQIVAGGGDDVLNGGADDDVLMGGLGNDTYELDHHHGGADIIVEEGGTDTIQVVGGHVVLAELQILRHGDDLLIRYHDHPADSMLIRSWFLDAKYRVERLALPDGTVVPLEPLAARAPQASSEDLIHFGPAAQGASPTRR